MNGGFNCLQEISVRAPPPHCINFMEAVLFLITTNNKCLHHLSICLSIHLFIYLLSIHLFIYLFIYHLSLCLSIYMSIYLSIYLSIYRKDGRRKYYTFPPHNICNFIYECRSEENNNRKTPKFNMQRPFL